jgi:hypothetical protein
MRQCGENVAVFHPNESALNYWASTRNGAALRGVALRTSHKFLGLVTLCLTPPSGTINKFAGRVEPWKGSIHPTFGNFRISGLNCDALDLRIAVQRWHRLLRIYAFD